MPHYDSVMFWKSHGRPTREQYGLDREFSRRHWVNGKVSQFYSQGGTGFVKLNTNQEGNQMNVLHLLDTKPSECSISGSSRFVSKGVMSVAALCLVSGPALAIDDNDPRFCTRTAIAVFGACQHEMADEFWIATGNCTNLSNPQAREQCKEEAKVARKEGKQECRAQLEARKEVCQALGEARYDPQIDPSLFVDPAQIGKTVAPNPYFPLIRGRTWVYQGGTEIVTVSVTEETKVILGVTTAVIRDVVEDNGEVIEDTKDWLAQDIHGNVWYFGEITQEFEDGELVSIDGSWTAGVDGAKAGFIMKAAPAVGDVYRQEFSLANAEDVAEVLSLTGSATVPAASCNSNCLITKDFTPIQPEAFEHKYFAPGVGFILEVKPDTGERLELIQIKN